MPRKVTLRAERLAELTGYDLSDLGAGAAPATPGCPTLPLLVCLSLDQAACSATCP